jgi:hypothetical protein
LRGYRKGAPHLFIWGVAWAIGYGSTYLAPARAGWIWAVVVVIGTIGSVVVLIRTRDGASGWRYGAAMATLYAFVIATFALMGPVNGRQTAAFIPLVVATSYVLGGLWWGIRFVVAGIVLAALTLGGFFLLAEHFLLWMAVVGSATLLLGGWWLRRT